MFLSLGYTCTASHHQNIKTSKYKFDLVGVQEGRWEGGGTKPAGQCTSFYGKGNQNPELGTASLHVQRLPTSEQPGYSPNERRTSMSVADRQKSLKRRIHLCSSAPATQHREARPATGLLPAESSLPYSANSHHGLHSAG
jgi:hypothetical protein